MVALAVGDGHGEWNKEAHVALDVALFLWVCPAGQWTMKWNGTSIPMSVYLKVIGSEGENESCCI